MGGTSEVASFYRDRSVFITGATGFMGKLLVEKLLRSCKDISAIYILIRPKRGKEPAERVKDLLCSPAFQILKDTQPEQLTKIKPIIGDILQPNLGISEEDMETLRESVTVVFHLAASIRFDEPLKIALDVNVRGVERMLAVVKKLDKLEVLVHVSTAFVNLLTGELNEDPCPTLYDPRKLSLIIDELDDDTVNCMEKSVLKGLPNTYSLCKILGEKMVTEEKGSYTVAIIRPGIVTAACQEPIPGWTDSPHGAPGMLAAYTVGLNGTAHIDKSKKYDVAPVDFCNNLTIVAPWFTSKYKPGSTSIYANLPVEPNRPCWRHLHDTLVSQEVKYPFSKAVWAADGAFRASRLEHELYMWIVQYPSAFLFDLLQRVIGGKPIFVRTVKKLDRGMECLRYYTVREWKTKCDNALALYDQLSDQDKEEFNFDPRPMDWTVYFENQYRGIRRYILNDDDSTIPAARIRRQRLVLLRNCLRILVAGCLFVFILLKTNAF